MSQPEWMKKFQEIGQKGQEAVVTIGDSGIEKSGDTGTAFEIDKAATAPPPAPWQKELSKRGTSDDAAVASKAPEVKKDESDDDVDAAALFAAAGSKPAQIKRSDSGDSEDAAALFAAAGTKPADEKGAEEEDDAAALFAAAGSKPAEVKVDEEEDAAALFAKAGTEPAGGADESKTSEGGGTTIEEMEEEIIEEEVVDESVIEESVVEESIIEESVVSDSQAASTEGSGQPQSETLASQSQEGESALGAMPEQKMTDEEFGDTWVVDKEQVINELSTTKFEEVEVERDTANVHYDEVYIDENGNEVVVQRGDGGSDGGSVEEVVVDENGNEIDGDYYEEEVPRSTNTLGSVEEIVMTEEDDLGAPGARGMIDDEPDVPTQPVYDPAYDVENQRKLLQSDSKENRSRMGSWVPYMCLSALIFAIVLVTFFVFLADDDRDINTAPTAAPTPRQFLPLDPTNTGEIDVAATTPLNSVTGNCDFRRVLQPHVIDQCSCTGSISIVADDIQARYDLLKDTFMPDVIPGFDEEISSCAASNQALVWLSSGVNNAGEADAFVRRERFVLAYFYIEQGGIDWTDNGLWLSPIDVCLWDRVSCNSEGRVVEMDLTRNAVIGQLSGAFSLLESLESFLVPQNLIAGTIPPEVFSTPKLRSIDFSSNAFFGEVPEFPEGTTIESIEVQSNNLSGSLKSDFSNAKQLSVLNVANNAFNNELPVELFTLPLKELYLAPNFFSGSIPDAIGNATSLTDLALGPNKFSGDIPVPIGQLTSLTRLVIEMVPELTGRLPASYGVGLTKMREFVLTGTDVRGNIPDQFGLMTDLEILNLSRNSLARALPESLGLLTSLKTLNLNDNAFTGSIPSELGGATSLVNVQMQVNQLVGSIPSSLGGLQNLETLALDGNFIDGRAPDEVCDLRQAALDTFTVDCAERVSDVLVIGVICSIPSCCTECF